MGQKILDHFFVKFDLGRIIELFTIFFTLLDGYLLTARQFETYSC